jgi:hypothetical protein
MATQWNTPKGNIRHYTTSFGTRAIHSLRCWNLHFRMRRSEEASLVLSMHYGMTCSRFVHLTHGSGVFRWNLIENGIFTVDSMYNVLIQHDISVDSNKKIWKMKIALKNKVFVWYLHRGVICTKDNLAKRNWQGSKMYVFCRAEPVKSGALCETPN